MFCFRFCAIVLFTGFVATVSLADTVIKDPSSIAPFQLCFTDQGSSNPWPQKFIKPNQRIPFCLNQNLSINRYRRLTAFERDFFVAAAMWQSYFKSQYPVRIHAIINDARSRSGGQSLPGEVVNKYPMTIIYPSALRTLLGRSGRGRQRADIEVSVRSNSPYCYDLTPTKDQPTCTKPMRKSVRDFASILVHELGHGYGIRSLRIRNDSDNYGNFFNNRVSAFDEQTNNGGQYNDLLNNYEDYFSPGNGHPMVFTGESTRAYFSSLQQSPYLPLCNFAHDNPGFSQNFSHFCYGSCNHPVLMAGVWCLWKNKSSYRLLVGSLDLHILYDIGYAPVLKTTTATQDLRETLFNEVNR